jgi:anti-sigma B factor antagonist
MRDARPGTQLSNICWIETERHLDSSIVRLHGEFDLAAEKQFVDELGPLLDRGTATLVLDLRGLTFMDSTGLRMLVSLYNRAEEDVIDFAVLCDDGNVRNVLRETGLDGVLPIVHPSAHVAASEPPL